MRAGEDDRLWGLFGALLIVVVLISLPSLTYPYGRDQGLFHYVGSEWLRHGAIPYRDAVEHRPPGMHLIFGLLSLAFGDRIWPIRVVDVFLVVGLGLSCAAIVTPRTERVPRELGAFAILFATVVYYGFFTFRQTAQIDFTSMVLCFAALAAVRRFRSTAPAAIAAGLGVGLALIVKPPALFLGACVFLVLAKQALQEGATRKRNAALLAYATAFGALPWLVTITYFWAKGAISELYLWNFKVNAYYAVHERGVHSIGDVFEQGVQAFARLSPYSIGLLALTGVSLLAARQRKDSVVLRRHGAILLLCVVAWIGVLAQLKFYWYHHAVLLGPMTLLALSLLQDFERWSKSADWTKVVRSAFPAGIVLFAFPLSQGYVDWFGMYRDFIRYTVGELPTELYYERFQAPQDRFSASNNFAVGRWLALHANAGDSVAVRGFEPQIYMVAGLRYRNSRFFWTNFITDRRRSMLHDEWLAEEDAAFRRTPPRFVVAICDRGPVVCVDWHKQRAGYVQRAQIGAFRILELAQR